MQLLGRKIMKLVVFINIGLTLPGMAHGFLPCRRGMLRTPPRPVKIITMDATPRSSNRTCEDRDGLGDNLFDSIDAPGLLVGDMLSIAIGCQLLGLEDVLTDDEFWTSGGLLQPINIATSTSTLPTLIQRFSTSCISWIIAAIVGKGFTQESVETPQFAVKNALKLLVLYGGVFLILELAFAVSISGTKQASGADFFRTLYFTGITLVAARYINSSIFY